MSILINVLTNYNCEFYSSVALLKEKKLSMNLELLKFYGKEYDLDFRFISFTDISFSKTNYKNILFLYTSSEDPDLLYKGYIEDIIMGLNLHGAIVIPHFYFLRAHHNKVYMEILRDIILKDIDTGVTSKYFGSYEDFIKIKNNIHLPSVIKKASGAGSTGVALLKSEHDLTKLSRRISKSFNFNNIIKKLLWIWDPFSANRNKFIIQNFIPNLDGDFKVLIFWDKYYILSRKNRKNDFRASGSGNLNLNPEVPSGIFDFSKNIFTKLSVPVASLDIGFDGNRFYLIEFQCLHFGPLTLEKSFRFFKNENNLWKMYVEKSILEQEFVRSVSEYLKMSNNDIK
jgi:glutathione synthase/RimK-type ligase-like ATP-grasp enzyme